MQKGLPGGVPTAKEQGKWTWISSPGSEHDSLTARFGHWSMTT